MSVFKKIFLQTYLFYSCQFKTPELHIIERVVPTRYTTPIWTSHFNTPAVMKKSTLLYNMCQSKFKAVLMIFLDISSVVITEWIPEGQTVN